MNYRSCRLLGSDESELGHSTCRLPSLRPARRLGWVTLQNRLVTILIRVRRPSAAFLIGEAVALACSSSCPVTRSVSSSGPTRLTGLLLAAGDGGAQIGDPARGGEDRGVAGQDAAHGVNVLPQLDGMFPGLFVGLG